jgi:hypothetical protein
MGNARNSSLAKDLHVIKRYKLGVSRDILMDGLSCERYDWEVSLYRLIYDGR